MLRSTTTAHPLPSLAGGPSNAARLSFVTAGSFLFLLALLHLVRPDLDPSWVVISAYALGPHGWMMTLAFAALGVACGALATAVWPHAKGVLGRTGVALLSAGALGFALAAVFPTDPITLPADQATTRGSLHGVGATLGGLLPLAALFVSWALSRSPAWAAARRSLWLATAAVWVGELVFAASLAAMVPPDGTLGPDVLIGWPNRLMIVGCAAWLMVAARAAQRA